MSLMEVIFRYETFCKVSGTAGFRAFDISITTPFNRPKGFQRRYEIGANVGGIEGKFDGVDTFNGVASVTYAIFTPGDPPTGAQNCTARDVKYSATWTPGSDALAMPQGAPGVRVLDVDGSGTGR